MSVNPLLNGSCLESFSSFGQDQEDFPTQTVVVISVLIIAFAALGIAYRCLGKSPQKTPQITSDAVKGASQQTENAEPTDILPKGFTPKGTKAPVNMTPKAIAAQERREREKLQNERKKIKRLAKGKITTTSMLLSEQPKPSLPDSGASSATNSRSSTPSSMRSPNLSLARRGAASLISPSLDEPEEDLLGDREWTVEKPSTSLNGKSPLSLGLDEEESEDELLGDRDWDTHIFPKLLDEDTASRASESGISMGSEATSSLSSSAPSAASRRNAKRRARKKAQQTASARAPTPPVDPLYRPANPNVTFKMTWERQYSHYLGEEEVTHDPREGGEAQVIALVREACQFAFDNYHYFDSCKEFLQQVNSHSTSRVHIEKGLHQFRGPDKCHFRLIIGDPQTSTVCFHVNLATKADYAARQSSSRENLTGTDKWRIERLTFSKI